MGITRRLERTARDVARKALGAEDSPLAEGPRAAYARVLDGRHLWFALPVGEGAPVLVEPVSGQVVATSHAPEGTCADSDADHSSARWAVDDVLALRDGAELLLAAERDDRVQGVLPPHPADDTGLRTPLTPDGRWRLVLTEGEDGLLLLRRQRQAPGALLVEVLATGNEITLRLLVPEVDEAPASLVLLDKDGAVVAQVAPLTAPDSTGARSALVTVDRVPDDLRQHRVAVAVGDGVRVVTRHPDDVHVPDANGVLMPHLVDGSGDGVLARLAWSKAGVLQIKPPGSSRRSR